MWRQILFWAVAGPKHLQRFLLVWVLLLGLFFYAFVHDAFDGPRHRTSPPPPPGPITTRR
jgi:hypothetical protein